MLMIGDTRDEENAKILTIILIWEEGITAVFFLNTMNQWWQNKMVKTPKFVLSPPKNGSDRTQRINTFGNKG